MFFSNTTMLSSGVTGELRLMKRKWISRVQSSFGWIAKTVEAESISHDRLSVTTTEHIKPCLMTMNMLYISRHLCLVCSSVDLVGDHFNLTWPSLRASWISFVPGCPVSRRTGFDWIEAFWADSSLFRDLGLGNSLLTSFFGRWSTAELSVRFVCCENNGYHFERTLTSICRCLIVAHLSLYRNWVQLTSICIAMNLAPVWSGFLVPDNTIYWNKKRTGNNERSTVK